MQRSSGVHVAVEFFDPDLLRTMAVNAAILFEPEAYVLDGPKLMGRQAAGNAYVRAAVAGRQGEALAAYTPRKPSAEAFARLVKSIDPDAKAQWIPTGRLDLLAAAGTLYLPGPVLREAAMLRLRVGTPAYSLVGVTHTTASHVAMDAIASLPTVPLMPWDALICTSQAVLSTAKELLGAEREYLAWRFGEDVHPVMPQLPVIPLGVHASDFVFTDDRRRAARAELGLAEGDVAALFVGRLSFHAKAHPFAMYLGLEEAAQRTGKRIVLIQCGWFANEMIETAFKGGAAKHAPSVRAIFTDGRSASARETSWAAADIFVSLSDNIQETFGLAPVEAMAAGLPVVASDWNGYKDTIRDGIDGFLIPTTMPPPGSGLAFAAAHETEEITYDQYCGLACRTVAIDHAVLAERLTSLVERPELRRKLGESGRARANADFDWRHIYRRYQDLWSDLARLRATHRDDPRLAALSARAPGAAPSRLDPLKTFAHYPTRSIGPGTRVRLEPGASVARYRMLVEDLLFAYMPETLPSDALVEAILAFVGPQGATVEEVSRRVGGELGKVCLPVATLAKMGLVRLEAET